MRLSRANDCSTRSWSTGGSAAPANCASARTTNTPAHRNRAPVRISGSTLSMAVDRRSASGPEAELVARDGHALKLFGHESQADLGSRGSDHGGAVPGISVLALLYP